MQTSACFVVILPLKKLTIFNCNDKLHSVINFAFLAQSVEHAAVNRRVVGSSPTGGARNPSVYWDFFILVPYFLLSILIFLNSKRVVFFCCIFCSLFCYIFGLNFSTSVNSNVVCTCEYISSVVLAFECPSHFCTVLYFIPFSRHRVANVCLRLCMLYFNPCFSLSLLKLHFTALSVYGNMYSDLFFIPCSSFSVSGNIGISLSAVSVLVPLILIFDFYGQYLTTLYLTLLTSCNRLVCRMYIAVLVCCRSAAL